jgi:hypothetical protein
MSALFHASDGSWNNEQMHSSALSAEERSALDALAADLRRVFGIRLQSFAAYGLGVHSPDARPLHTVALVERLVFEDLIACASLASGWKRRGLPVPLLLERTEFLRTLDVFPIEYGDIIADHVVIAGSDPFSDLEVSASDIRRACELRAKSHLIHLREGFLETSGDSQAVSRLIAASAGAFRALLSNIARLSNDASDDLAESAERHIGIPASVVRDVFAAGAGAQSSIAEPTALLARYIAVVDRIWEYVDTWQKRR